VKLDDVLKVIAVLGALGSYLWGVYQWKEQQRAQLAQIERETLRTAEQRKIEAQKPFLERQLALYTAAVSAVSGLATFDIGTEEWHLEEKKFWRLYWGELTMVENPAVEAAMVEFGKALLKLEKYDKLKLKDMLEQRALALSNAARKSLDASWGIKVWTN